MQRARVILIVAVATAAADGAIVRGQTQRPERPMQVVKVKDNLYVLRGPFNKCAPNGCGAYADDGFLHEAGDVAVRVTPQGLIVVDDKYEENAAEVLSRIKSISNRPIRYLLNTHHHTDHAGADATFFKTTEILAYRNVHENFLRNNQPRRAADGLRSRGVGLRRRRRGARLLLRPRPYQRRRGDLLPGSEGGAHRRPHHRRDAGDGLRQRGQRHRVGGGARQAARLGLRCRDSWPRRHADQGPRPVGCSSACASRISAGTAPSVRWRSKAG